MEKNRADEIAGAVELFHPMTGVLGRIGSRRREPRALSFSCREREEQRWPWGLIGGAAESQIFDPGGGAGVEGRRRLFVVSCCGKE